MHLPSKPKVVLLGMMTKMPVAGVVWQNVHYLVGFERLGCEVYYVEEHARTPSMFMETEQCDGSTKAAAFIDAVMRRFDLADRWCLHTLHEENPRCFGMSRTQLKELYASADLIINLHGGTTPLPEHYATGRLIYLETDPCQLQIELHETNQETIEFLEPHVAFFTFGENLGAPDCGLPVSDRFHFKPTRQPVVMDFWNAAPCAPGDLFTSIGNWEQQWREVWFKGECYTWSKNHEFLKFIDLPSRTPQGFELALSSYTPEVKQMLESRGWSVKHALDISLDPDTYRNYIAGSRGEFTVAKDQNVRFRSGWFSDRSATYLAAGRPVITQDTGFGNSLPTGAGLFAFTSPEQILAAIEAVNRHSPKHANAAREIARDYFGYDTTLVPMLELAGISTAEKGAATVRSLPSQLQLTPLSRRPIRLPESTIRTVLGRPIPTFSYIPGRGAEGASIIVVTHNQLVFTRMCLESLFLNTQDCGFEVIVVDNASADGTPDYLRSLAQNNPTLRTIFNESNLGFAKATNKGLQLANGGVLVLLNNDTVVTPGWLARLLWHVEAPAVGLVGPVTNRIGNEAEIGGAYDTYGEMVEFARLQQESHRGRYFEIPTPCMFCLAFRRAVYESLGPLDEQFEIGMLEDDDYAERARAKGYQSACAEDVFVHHFGQASFGSLVPTGEYDRLLLANKEVFQKKWGRLWQPYARRHSAAYLDVKSRVKKIVEEYIPPSCNILVLSKGDEELLALGDRIARHFPRTEEGVYSGAYPADSAAAIDALERSRERGGDYLLLPAPSLWWLDYYQGFKAHLYSNYQTVISAPGACVIFDLNNHPR